jgi:hypothetical protein
VNANGLPVGLNGTEVEEVKRAMLDFCKRVMSGTENKTDAELEILPQVLQILLD